jgi:hypothetical protein
MRSTTSMKKLYDHLFGENVIYIQTYKLSNLILNAKIEAEA